MVNHPEGIKIWVKIKKSCWNSLFHIMRVIPASTHSDVHHHVSRLPACLPDSKRNYEQKRFPHTWLPSPYHYYSEERRVPSNQKYTRINRACPANDNCREWHTFPSQASQIKPGCSGPSVTCVRNVLLLNTRSWFQYLRATMRIISQSSRCVIRHCSTICHTRTKTKHNYPPMLIKKWDMKALLFWQGGQSGLYMCA